MKIWCLSIRFLKALVVCARLISGVSAFQGDVTLRLTVNFLVVVIMMLFLYFVHAITGYGGYN